MRSGTNAQIIFSIGIFLLSFGALGYEYKVFDFKLKSLVCGDERKFGRYTGKMTFNREKAIEESFLDLINSEAEDRGIDVEWERSTIYDFTEDPSCESHSGNRRLGTANTAAATKLSSRGKCKDKCSSELSPPNNDRGGSRRLDENFFNLTGEKFFAVGYLFEIIVEDVVDCDLDSECYNNQEGRCCGVKADCYCPKVSYSECYNSTHCDSYGGMCCDSKFATPCEC